MPRAWWVTAAGALDRRSQRGGRRAALQADILVHRRERWARAARQERVVVADDREVGGHLQTPILGVTHHARGDDVREAQDGGGAGGLNAGEQHLGGGEAGLLPGVGCVDDRRRDPEGLEDVEPPIHPARRRVAPAQPTDDRDDARRRVVLGGDDRNPAMSEVDQVLRRRPRAATIVDVHRRVALHGGVVDEHERQLALLQPFGRHRRCLARVDERGIHRYVACGQQISVRSRGEQRQGHSRRCELGRDRRQQARGDLVGERVLEAVGEQDADRPGRSPGESPGRWVGARVPERVGGGEDHPPQLGRQLIRAREGVGHRHTAHADPVGDRLKGHAGHGPILVGGRFVRRTQRAGDTAEDDPAVRNARGASSGRGDVGHRRRSTATGPIRTHGALGG